MSCYFLDTFCNLTLTIQPNLAFKVGDFVQVTHDVNNYIIGQVTSYDVNTGVINIDPIDYCGSGNYCDWTVNLAGKPGIDGTMVGSEAVIVSGSTTNSSIRKDVGNTATVDYSAALAGSGNTATGIGSFVGGGFDNSATTCNSVVVGGQCNTASGYFSTVIGGCCNTSSACSSFVGGGLGNNASGCHSTVSGGYCNTASGSNSNVSGGYCNTASGYVSTVSGGYCNTASGVGSTVSGGGCNTASCVYSTVSGGGKNNASGDSSFIGGGCLNCNQAVLGSIGGGGINILGCYDLSTATCLTSSTCVYCVDISTSTLFINGDVTADLQVGNCLAYFNYFDNKVCSGTITCSTYSGGYTQIEGIGAGSCSGYLGGILRNLSLVCNSDSKFSQILGGIGNTISCSYSFIGGGKNNTASHVYSTVSGGLGNTASGYRSTVSGGFLNTASNGYSTVSGGRQNNASCAFSTVSGGICNTASNYYSTVSGGYCNTASGYRSFVGGGFKNIASEFYSTILNGCCNTNNKCYSTIINGGCNTIDGQYSFIGGGCNNLIYSGSNYSSILGGQNNNTCGFENTFILGCNICAIQSATTFVNCLYSQNLTGGTTAICVDANGIIVRNTSDQRMKTCISQLTYGISEVSQLNPVSFYWCDNVNQQLGCNKQVGFIAQEVETIIPEAVGQGADGIYSLDPNKIIPALVKSIQELTKRVEELEKK